MASRWRTSTPSGDGATRDGEQPIDASGVFPDGTKFDGIAGLKKELLRQPEQFVGTVAERLLMYAIGRNLQYYDAPTVRAVMRDAEPANYTLRVAGARDREEPSVPDARGRRRVMFITKKALPRRTFLRAMGTTLALPLLDAMVPALSARAASRRRASASSTSPTASSRTSGRRRRPAPASS